MQIPNFYEFCCRVKTISGHKALNNIPDLLKSMSSRKPMIIADKGVSKAGLIKIVTDALKGSKIKIGDTYTDVPPDSEIKVVNELAKIYKKKGCDSILAVGGGSVLDTAKGVNILVSENSDDLIKFSGYGIIKRPLKPLIAIPTTAGTGSEVTLVAVIADHEKNIKMVFPSTYLMPDVAILDPRMTVTLPPFLTALTAMDALTHSVEAYTCLAKNPVSDAHAITAIELINKNLLKVIKKPGDIKGRLALANAALLAGAAFSNSMVGMIHSLGHSIGAVCGAAHGACMSILLPYGLEYNHHKNSEYTAELLFPLGGSEIYAKTAKEERADKVIELIRKLNSDLKNSTRGAHACCLKDVKDKNGDLQIPKDKIPQIARAAISDGSIIYNPEELDYEDCVMTLEHAWEGIPLDRSKIKKG